MKKPSLLLIGAGGHARSCIDVIEQEGKYQVVGLTGDPTEVGTFVLGYKVLGTDEILPELVNLAQFALITVGQIGVHKLRSTLYSKTTQIGFESPVVISPTAYVSPHSTIGIGTVIMHRATINAGAKIGINCIINSHALIEHDVNVEDHCHIATSATINGGSTVGKSSFVGSGTTIRESITIGHSCSIGMGMSVRHNLPPNSQFVGE